TTLLLSSTSIISITIFLRLSSKPNHLLNAFSSDLILRHSGFASCITTLSPTCSNASAVSIVLKGSS
ncbi:MAG: hypothetical protein WBX01_00260, partial [Nitrososphaeraceae archaeon]